MNIDAPLRHLGDVDVGGLQEAVLALGEEAWQSQPHRQETYAVHQRTQSLVLVFTDGAGWPDIEVTKESGWPWLAEPAVPLMHGLIERHYPKGGAIIRAMVAKLAAGGRIETHRDGHPSFHCSHRIHVPLSSNPRVRFMIDGRPFRLEMGQAYEINNQLAHSVMNKGAQERITFIFDYLPPDAKA